MALAPCWSAAWHCHQPANPPACRAAGSSSRRPERILPALEPGSSTEMLLWAGAARCAALGPAGAGPLNKMFISAGHFFSSSSGTGLLEGICLCIPAGAWGETVKKWLKHSALLQPMPFLYCSVLSLIFFFLMRMQMSEDLTLPFYYLLVVLQ